VTIEEKTQYEAIANAVSAKLKRQSDLQNSIGLLISIATAVSVVLFYVISAETDRKLNPALDRLTKIETSSEFRDINNEQQFKEIKQQLREINEKLSK